MNCLIPPRKTLPLTSSLRSSTAAQPRSFPSAGCRGENGAWWHRRIHFWRTSSGVLVVSSCPLSWWALSAGGVIHNREGDLAGTLSGTIKFFFCTVCNGAQGLGWGW